MCKGLFKFFNSKKYRDDFLNGHLYFSSLNSFRKVEKSEVFGQNDCYECCDILQPDSVKVTIGNTELTDFAGPISICSESDVLRSNIMCFSTIGMDVENVLFPEKMTEYGEFVVAIPQAELFIERLGKVVKGLDLKLYRGAVKYYDFSKDNISCGFPEIAFQKRSEFSYQREFRFLLQKREPNDAPLILEVSDLSDIAISCKSCDLNGMIDVRYRRESG